MNLLTTIYESDINPEATNADSAGFKERHAARAVVVDDAGRVALLKVNKHSFHKLPGGGVEAGEDYEQALERELMEEIGCKATVTAELGQVVEYRDRWQMRQVSECFIAKAVGEQVAPNFDDGELDDDFEMMWAENIDEAIALLEQDQTNNYDGKFINIRDLTLLRIAKQLL